jgi:hypothetical protein
VVSSRLLERSSLLGAVQARNEHYMVTALRGASGYTTIIEIPEGTNPRMSDIDRQGALQISIRRKVTFTANDQIGINLIPGGFHVWSGKMREII